MIKFAGKPQQDLKDFLDAYDFKQHIVAPTRIARNSSSLLDLVITETKARVRFAASCLVDVSDHCLTALVLKDASKRTSCVPFPARNLRRVNPEVFQNRLREADWSPFQAAIDASDPDLAAEVWSTTFLGVLDQVAPVKLVRPNPRFRPWLTPRSRIGRSCAKTSTAKRLIPGTPKTGKIGGSVGTFINIC